MDGLDALRLTGTPGAGFGGSPDKAGTMKRLHGTWHQ